MCMYFSQFFFQNSQVDFPTLFLPDKIYSFFWSWHMKVSVRKPLECLDRAKTTTFTFFFTKIGLLHKTYFLKWIRPPQKKKYHKLSKKKCCQRRELEKKLFLQPEKKPFWKDLQNRETKKAFSAICCSVFFPPLFLSIWCGGPNEIHTKPICRAVAAEN